MLFRSAQAITAPVLACATNSPILLGRRLWRETRVALFQQSVDGRSQTHQLRGRRPRVNFGDGWVKNSVLEIFREDIARFRLLLATDIDEDPESVLDRGGVPALTALRLHNGTVYRWNRACYGISDGKPHLRIEARALPAGPTVLDEIANGAFFFGLMSAISHEVPDVSKVMSFDDAKGNFIADHEGIEMFTIGQRKGLPGGSPRPRYVIDIDPQTNRVIVGDEEDLVREIGRAHV